MDKIAQSDEIIYNYKDSISKIATLPNTTQVLLRFMCES